MTTVATPGIDLAKSVFSVHGVDRSGKAVLRCTVRREQLTELIANLLPCHIEMEVCPGAHERAQRFGQYGHDVRLMAPPVLRRVPEGRQERRQRRGSDLGCGEPPEHAICASQVG